MKGPAGLSSHGHGKPGKVMEFKNGHFQAWKSHGKHVNHKRLGKVMEICINHMFIQAEFKIINMFFKGRRSKYKPAYALDTHKCSGLFMFIPRFQFGHGNVV